MPRTDDLVSIQRVEAPGTLPRLAVEVSHGRGTGDAILPRWRRQPRSPLTSRNTYSPPAAEPVRPQAPVVFSRNSVPTFATPVRPVQPHVTAPAAVASQPQRPQSFIQLPRGTDIGSARAPSLPSLPRVTAHPGVTAIPEIGTTPRLSRGLGISGSAASGLGTMPAVDQYFQKRGQNLQS